MVFTSSPTRTIFTGVLTVPAAFYSAASAANNLLQLNITTTIGTTTVLQTAAVVTASL